MGNWVVYEGDYATILLLLHRFISHAPLTLFCVSFFHLLSRSELSLDRSPYLPLVSLVLLSLLTSHKRTIHSHLHEITRARAPTHTYTLIPHRVDLYW